MASQLDIFGGAGVARESAAALPEGFRYKPELIGTADEAALLARVRELPFREFEFHGYTGKRRVVSFGWHYGWEHSIPAVDSLRYSITFRNLRKG
jgi:hypothetical protein